MRKNFLLLTILAFLVSCSPDSNQSDTTQASVAPAPESNSGIPPRTSEPVHVPASVLAPMISLWHYSSVSGIKDPKIRDAYLGRWIDLKGDQTFTSGIWEEQNNSGKWTFDPETQLINFHYASAEGIFDEFKIQGVGRDEVIFKGNTSRTTRGIQIRMVKENERPIQ